jgi:hypothetical protein
MCADELNPDSEAGTGGWMLARGAHASGVWFSASRRKLRPTKPDNSKGKSDGAKGFHHNSKGKCFGPLSFHGKPKSFGNRPKSFPFPAKRFAAKTKSFCDNSK